MIGLTGSHRTGKTTLARAWAAAAEYKFLETSASAVFERLGLSPKANYPIELRLYIQREILRSMIEQYREATQYTITDRTPLDMAAYMLADVQREPLSDVVTHGVLQYVEDCFTATNAYFNVLVLLQPGIPLVEEAGKAPANIAYMEHLTSILKGFLGDRRISIHTYEMPRELLSIEERVEAIGKVRDVSMKRHVEHFRMMVNTLGKNVIH